MLAIYREAAVPASSITCGTLFYSYSYCWPWRSLASSSSPSSYTCSSVFKDPLSSQAFVQELKSLSSSGPTTIALQKGRVIHGHIIETDIASPRFLSNTLIDFYSKCNSLVDAHSVFDGVSQRDLITWNTMISGYIKHGYGDMALCFFWQMHVEGFQPDKYTIVSILKACCNIGALCCSRIIHVVILACKLDTDVYVGTGLVHMYSTCRNLTDASKVFNCLENRNAPTWNVMISGLADHGDGLKAINTFQEMLQYGIDPNDVSFISVLKACAIIQSLDCTKLVHFFITETGFEQIVMIGTSLVDSYSKSGSILDARAVFDSLHNCNSVTWFTMITGYVDHRCGKEALDLFMKMHNHHGFIPNDIVLVALLKACCNVGHVVYGNLVYVLLVEDGFPLNAFVGSSLISLYAKCGDMEDAHNVFDRLPEQSLVTYGAIIDGYSEHQHSRIAVEMFFRLTQQGFKPNNVIFLSVLKACTSMKSLNEGILFHIQIIECGYDSDLYIRNTLIDMYSKCGSIAEALDVFHKLPNHNVMTWNAVMSGFLYQGDDEGALHFFQNMLAEGVEPNNVTFPTVLKASCNKLALNFGMVTHMYILSNTISTDIHVQTALIDLYAKHGCLEDAQKIFKNNSMPNLAPWNAVMCGYAQQGYHDEVLRLFDEMIEEGIRPDTVTIVNLLQACSHTTAFVHGLMIHCFMVERCCLSNLFVGNSLIDFYIKCGSLRDARKVFDGLERRDIVSWSSMISGFAQKGDYDFAFEYFKRMHSEGCEPNHVTFGSLLSACSRIGLVNQACVHMEQQIRKFHGIPPAIENYNAMADVFARAGLLLEAKDLIETAPHAINLVGWATLLSHCNKHGNLPLGKESFDRFVMFDSGHASGYIQMISLLMQCGCFERSRISK